MDKEDSVMEAVQVRMTPGLIKRILRWALRRNGELVDSGRSISRSEATRQLLEKGLEAE